MEQEQSQNFHERLSQWVSSQGFWFQLRYSLAGSGAKGAAAFHVLRLAARLGVFLLILAVGGGVYLIKRASGDGFREGAEAAFSDAVGAADTSMRGVSRSAGELAIARVGSIGGENSFFHQFEARGVTAQMGLLDGLRDAWDPGTIGIAHLDIDLRLDGQDVAGFLGSYKGVEVNSFEVENANLRWNGPQGDSGAIEGSALRMQRVKGQWRMQFSGGRFSQNWLRRLEIVNLVIQGDPTGFKLENASFRLGKGTVELAGVRLDRGDQGGLRGRAVIRGLPLSEVLPATAREFVEGEISGDFALSGWLDQPEGIEFDGIVKLGDSGGISLKDSIHVLRALSVVDPYNKYRSVNFSEGSFRLKTGAGRAEFSEVKLSAGELMRMEGGMVVRPQTLQEAQQAAVRVPGLPTLGNGFGDDPHRAEKSAAIQGARRPLASDGNDGVFERIGRANADRSARDDQAEENFRSLRYEGEFRLALPANVFERSAILAAAYPPNPATSRVTFPVKFSGALFELTMKQAEDVYLRGRSGR
jgi:hypothetical protein